MPRRYPLAHMFCTRTNQPTSAEMTWGPNAHELLMASLGACANMTVQMYAERHQYPLKGLQAGVSCTRVLAENPPGSDAKFGMVDRLRWTSLLPGSCPRSSGADFWR
jgi:organic hydroperoxide reductase OsmC/OhrA